MTAEQLTVSRTTYSPLLQAADMVCGLAAGLGLSIGTLDLGDIVGAAQRRTGLRDLGPDDFVVPMRMIVEATDRAAFSRLARVITRQTLITGVANRLRVEEYFRRHPDAHDVPVERPVFILGFPRTGTTLLQNLLSLEPGTRSLKFWELQTPVPESEDPARDRRIRLGRATRTLQAAYLIAPEMETVHEIGPETSEECWPLFVNTFAVLNWDLASGLAPYGRWLLQQDMTAPYAYYKKQLQMMAHFRPTKQFVLKCPEHLWFVDDLLKVFPDALLVWTHRDPVDCVASYCSLVSLNRRMLYARVDPRSLGAEITDRFATGVERAMAARDRNPGAAVFDVSFQRLVQDTPGVVAEIRRTFDLPIAPGAEQRLSAWLDNERKDKRGAHKYDPATYGLSAPEVHQRFRTYIDRFQVPIKD